MLSWNCLVSKVAGYGVDDWGLISDKGGLFLCIITCRLVLESNLPPIQWCHGPLPGVKEILYHKAS
jgi:hypothetical protein